MNAETLNADLPPRRILHLDMDAFFASVELLRQPALRGRPLIIGGRGDPSRRGVVSTCTYEARAFGVRSGMPLRTAARLCPEAVYMPTDFAAYSHWSRRFKALMREVSPLFEDRGIDEAFLDITALAGSAEDIAQQLKARIFADSGLRCSIGVAPNKLLAKIASELDKPDGFTLIRPEDVATRIWPLEVRRIPGVGPKADERLASMQIRTIGQLAQMPQALLSAAFGARYAGWLHEAAHGRIDKPLSLHREPRSRSRETTYQEDTRDWQVVAGSVVQLCRKLADDLQRAGYAGRTIGLKLRFSDFETLTRDRTLAQPTADALIIRKAAFECLARVNGSVNGAVSGTVSAEGRLSRRVRLVGVRVGELSPLQALTPELELLGGG
jgi:DNA polymerase-4